MKDRHRITAILMLAAIAGGFGARAQEPPASAPQSRDNDDADFAPLFDGETLDGWEKVGGEATYRVEDSAIVGTVGPGPNTFLRTKKEFADFELRLEFRWDDPCNSGIQFRSHRNDKGVVYGYQCEIDPTDRAWTCGIYDESRRGWLFDLKDNPEAQAALKKDDWNRVRILVVGDHIQTWLNDVPCADFHDDADASGFIALQVHSGSKGQLRWRNILVREIKDEDARRGDPESERERDGGGR